MRLTCKGTNLLLVNKEFGNEMYLKLMQLENIEDELGIDLITLFDYKESPFAAFKIEQDKENDVIFFDGDSFYGDYSKEEFLELIKRLIEAYRETWALTKEELL